MNLNLPNFFEHATESKAPLPSSAERGELAPIAAGVQEFTAPGTIDALNALRIMHPNRIMSPPGVFDPSNPVAYNGYGQAQPLPSSPAANVFAINRTVRESPAETHTADVPTDPNSFLDGELNYAAAVNHTPAHPYLGAVAAAPEVSQQDYVEGLSLAEEMPSNVLQFPVRNTAEAPQNPNPGMDIDAIRRSIYDIQTGHAA
jgi:hypothetical protein